MGAVEKGMLLNLCAISIALEVLWFQVNDSIRRVSTQSETCHTTNNVTRKVKRHTFGKDVWQMHDQGRPLCRKGAPLMVTYH